ncbi:MAG: motility associated factor glycosyltransferase family protein [Nitrospinae bacterium]|nr:motility associated factor glycosyltransferase family protein [Nitrospinota bacterium]
MNEQRLYEVKQATIALLAERWEQNYLLNRGAIAALPGVAKLFGRFAGIPAVLAGAGPSLDRNVRLLAVARGKSVVIACDAALKPLAALGLVPDIVVNLDPQLYTSNFFEGVDTKNITLIAPTIVHPSLREMWKGPFFFYNKHAPDIPILAKISLNHPQVGALIPGGSVLSVAYDLAFKSGADPIAFIGQDLGYPGGNAYAAGTHFDSFEAESIFDQQGDVIVEERDLFGRALKTQKSMAVTKQWFGWAFATWQPERKRRIFNCSEAGILTNCPLMTFGEFVSRFCRKGVNVAWGIKKAAKG